MLLCLFPVLVRTAPLSLGVVPEGSLSGLCVSGKTTSIVMRLLRFFDTTHVLRWSQAAKLVSLMHASFSEAARPLGEATALHTYYRIGISSACARPTASAF